MDVVFFTDQSGVFQRPSAGQRVTAEEEAETHVNIRKEKKKKTIPLTKCAVCCLKTNKTTDAISGGAAVTLSPSHWEAIKLPRHLTLTLTTAI